MTRLTQHGTYAGPITVRQALRWIGRTVRIVEGSIWAHGDDLLARGLLDRERGLVIGIDVGAAGWHVFHVSFPRVSALVKLDHFEVTAA